MNRATDAVDQRPASIARDVACSLMVIRGQCHAIVRAGRRADEVVARIKLVDAELTRIARATAPDRVIADLERETDAVALARRAVQRFDGAAGAAGARIVFAAHLGSRRVVMRQSRVVAMLDQLLTRACEAAGAGDVITLSLTGRTGVAVLHVTIDAPRGGPGRDRSWQAIVGSLVDGRHAEWPEEVSA